MSQPDYSIFDVPQILNFMFHPRQDLTPPSQGATDHPIAAPDGVSLCGRFYPLGKNAPTILFFHGNGEVASDYDDIAPLYHQIGVNLFVADYRGYGKSQGAPTVSSLVTDSHASLCALNGLLKDNGYRDDIFIMGRSLGAYCAVELAARKADQLNGVITESGAAGISRVLDLFGLRHMPGVMDVERHHEEKLCSIDLPFLIIHGSQDTLVPISMAQHLYEAVNSRDKCFVTIEGAGHNDIMWVGREQYFKTIKDFVLTHV